MQMKKQRIAVVLIAAGLGLANAVVQGQETVPPDQSRTSERERDASYRKGTESYNRSDYARSGDVKHGQHVKASKLIGMKVENDQGERLGKIDDLIIDSNYNVKFAVISHGGALGVAQKRIAVPMNELNCSPDRTIRLSATKEQLRDASRTPPSDWMVVSGQEWNSNIDGYYGHPKEVSVTEHRRYKDTDRTFERETVYDSFDREPVRTVQGAGARDLIRHPDHADLFNEPLIGKERTDNYNSNYRPSTALTSDEATQQRICDNLRQNYSARTPETVSVTVQDGVVTLKGTVDSATEKRNIETTVKQMSGVRRVNNNLTVQNR